MSSKGGRNCLSLNTNTTYNSRRERHTSRPCVTPGTPVPKTPLPWIWICHKCRHSYPFKATPRCLSCSHRFCGKCNSELDYSGWMVYDSYWSRKAGSTTVAKRRCVWVTERTNSLCEANSADTSGEGHEKFGYEAGNERSMEELERNREEEERIWREWQSADLDIEHHQTHAEAAANNSIPIEPSVPPVPRRSRKRSLAIITDGVVEDVALNSVGQELNWDPLLHSGYPPSPNSWIGTSSFTWEESLLNQISEGNQQDDENWEGSEVDTVEHIIDPRLLAKTALDCREA